MTLPILICDDSKFAQKQMSRGLPEGWDVSPSFANDGLEGLEFIRKGLGNVVFLDLNMPNLDGYGVLEAVQKEDLPALIIVVSGDIQPEAHQRVMDLGALDFIKKPTTKDKIAEILERYGIWKPGDSPPVSDKPAHKIPHEAPLTTIASLPTASEASPSTSSDIEHRDLYQEISNVAMGRAADLLARMLNAFVVLPIPNVNILALSELHMALNAVEQDDTISAVCQGYIGAGIAGEALLLFHDSSFSDMAKLMNYPDNLDDSAELEVLMDTANILIGAFLKGFADQLDMSFSQGHPMVLGQHSNISRLIEASTKRWQKTMAIEINYRIEKHNIQCDLLLLFTEDSLPTINKKIIYLES
jgi:chemotaxis protein CheY-P-specific phosphatase CheC/ActR/RegA family two-component response regulator